jgi:hypothetical protein
MKEPKKIYVDNDIWEGIVKMANLEGCSIGDLIAKLFNDKYAWKGNTVEFSSKPKPNIRSMLLACIETGKIPKEDYDKYEVLYCKECMYIDVRSKYGIAPWLCSKGHKYEPLGILKAFFE